MSTIELAKELGITQSAVSRCALRGEKIVAAETLTSEIEKSGKE